MTKHSSGLSIILALAVLTTTVSCGSLEEAGGGGSIRDPAASVTLEYRGNNGHPSDAFPLGLCEGDCDTDDDCRGHLKCFQRDNGEKVPGCSGDGHAISDYCYDPQGSSGSGEIVDKGKDPAGTLGRCEGDCDSHDQCEGSLVCFERDNYEPVPGCSGRGKRGHDYCVDADPRPEDAGEPKDDGGRPGHDSGEPPGSGPFCPPMVWAVYYPWFRDVYPFDDSGPSAEELTADRAGLRKRAVKAWKSFKDHPIGPDDMHGAGMVSYDKVALMHQVEQALDAGIDGFIPYYRGWDTDKKRPHFTEGAIGVLFKAVNEVNTKRNASFRIGMHLSVQAAHERKENLRAWERLKIWTDRFLEKFGQEKALMRINGRVLAVAYSTARDGFSAGDWKNYRQRLGSKVFMLADNGSSNSHDEYVKHFDGSIYRSLSDKQSSLDRARRRGNDLAGANKLWLAEVRPNEKRVSSQRGSTAFFEATFTRAAAAGARWLRIVSWNEYAEYTHIEPSDNYGHRFLDAARTEIATWKAQARKAFCR